MKSTPCLNRRQFLSSTATLALTLAARPMSAAAAGSSWPIASRDAHLKATGRPDAWSALEYLGINGLELDINQEMSCANLFGGSQPYSLATAASRAQLKQDLQAHQCAITALCMSNRLDEQLAKELDWMRRAVEAAQDLKVTAIRIDVVPRAIRREEFLPFAITACRQLCDIVQGTPVRLGIENHGNTTNDPEFLDKLFRGVGSKQLGLTLDPCNFYWFGHPLSRLYEIYEQFASRAFHTHCKNIRYPEDQRNVRRAIGWEYGKFSAPVHEGDIDYARVVSILRRANYTGDLCLENECLGHYPKPQQPEVLKAELAHLRKLPAA